MLNREDWYMIKEMRSKGCYLKDIAAKVGVSERTVRRALKRGGPPPKRRRGIRPGKLDPYKADIDAMLADQVWNAEVIYIRLREKGYTGSRTLVRDYVRPKRVIRKAIGTVRFETPPGRQLQSDWGQTETRIGGQPKRVHFAVNLLGFSRRFHVWAAFRADAEHTYESLIRAFEWFGGVPEEVWVDNQKAAVLSHPPEGPVRFNPGFVQLAEHYGFTPKACRPYRPQTKGKDERMVRYLKENFFQRYRSFESLEHLNQQLEHWLRDVADPRRHGTLREQVSARFEREAPALQPLPPRRFDTSYRETRRVALDAFIDVLGNRYSVPAHLCGQQVVIHRTLDGELRVFDSTGSLVATHRLRSAEDGWQVVPEHHARLWQQTRVQARSLQSYEEAAAWN